MVAAASDKGKEYSGKLTSYVFISCMIACTAGLIFGYDIGISGGVTSMESFLIKFFPAVYRRMKNDPHLSNYCKFDSQKLTFFTSSLYMSALVATFFAASITKNFGRKVSILIGGFSFLIGSAIGGGALNVYMLIIGRVMLGIGIGFSNQSAPLYISEIAPPKHRGAFIYAFDLLVGVGNLVANLVNYGTVRIKGWGWRISLAMAGVPALIFAIGSLFLDETPVSLIQKGGDHEKAVRLLQKIRGTNDVEEELNDLVRVSEISKSVKHPFRNLRQRKYRPQLVMSIAIPCFQQMGGINALSFFAPIIFRTIGLSENMSLLLALVVTGVVGSMSMLLALPLVDRLGRRLLLGIGGTGMFVTLTVVGAIMTAQLGDQGAMSKGYGYVTLIFIAIYVASFGISWGPLGYLIPGEIFPLEIRSAAQSVNIGVQMFFTALIGQVFLAMLCHMKAAIFFFFAAWVLGMTLFVYLLLPETKDIPIERMEKVWREHWFWKKFVNEDDGAPISVEER